MSSTAPVLVVGAGPSGLVTALTLLKNGIPVRIITKEHTPRLGQRGPGISPRTLEVFHFLDVPQVNQTATMLQKIRAYKAGTLEVDTTFTMFPPMEPTPAIPYYNYMLIGQETLEGILRSRLEEYGCRVEFGLELRSLEQDGERVVAHIIKRVGGEEVLESVDTPFLVGADGAHGTSRKQLGLMFLGETRDSVRTLIGDIRLVSSDIDRDHWHWFGNFGTKLVVLRPTNEIGPDGFQFIVTPGQDYDVTKMTNDSDLLIRCMSELTTAKLQLNEVKWTSEWRPNIRMVNKFGVGRVFLVGDAAHVHSPTGGQGLNSSVQDAFNVAWKIALVYKGLSSPSLLETYSAERIPVITEMLGLTTGILNEVSRTDLPSVQDTLTRDLSFLMLGVNYRHSPIVVDEFSEPGPLNAYGDSQPGVLIAGDRAPDAPKLVKLNADGEETRLFDIFRPQYHTVLVFGSDDDFIRSVVSGVHQYDKRVVCTVIIVPSPNSAVSVDVDQVLYDKEGHAHAAYIVESGQTRVVIVRPDGVVGAIVRGVEGVHKYFSQVLH